MKGRLLICCLSAVSVLCSSCGVREKTTTIALASVKRPGKEFYNVYRYAKPITEDNYRQAERVASRIRGDQTLYSPPVTQSGTAYYLVTICDVWGRETRSFNAQTVLGPFEERDVTPPKQAIDLRLAYVDNSPSLSWDLPPYGNPENIAGYHVYRSRSSRRLRAKKHLIATVDYHPMDEQGAYVDSVKVDYEMKHHYSVVPVDSSGNEMRHDPSLVVTAIMSAELSIGSGETIVENRDFSTTKMYPVKGETVSYTFRIKNNGAKRAANIPVDVRLVHRRTQQEQVIFTGKVVRAIEQGQSHEVSFDWTPQATGAHDLRVAFNEDQKEFEQDYTDNEAQVRVDVVEKDVYFIWYGDPIELTYVNAPQAHADLGDFQHNKKEWHRRGARYLHFAHLGATPEHLNNHLKKGVDGVLVDELGPVVNVEAIEGLVKTYAEHKETFPDSFVAVWKVGAIHSALAEELKKENAAIDLFLFELYFHVNSPEKVWQGRLLQNINAARKLGCLHRCIVGLGSAAGYGGAKPEKHAAFLEEQIAFIRKHAPEMPGIAFFTSSTLPGVGEAVDRACFEYFVEQTNQEESK